MQKQFTSAIAKKAITLCAVFMILNAGSTRVYASNDRSVVSPVEISYKGPKDKLLNFKVDYKNELGKPFQLVIKNEQNEVLYSRRYEAKPLSTEIFLADVPAYCKLTFTIDTEKKQFSESFEITKEIKTVENVLVKGL